MRTMTIQKFLILVSLWTYIITLCFIFPRQLSPYPPTYPQVSSAESRVPDHLDAYLDRLISHECQGCAPHFRRIDSNNYYSYGCLQFQRATFDMMSRRYGFSFQDPERIYDCEAQRSVARAMFLDDPIAASKHWYNSIYSFNGIGLP